MLENTPHFADILLGVIAGALLTIVLSFPRTARAIGKAFAVALMGAGAGLITWGLFEWIGGGDFTKLAIGSLTFFNPAQVLGWGVGCLIAGIVALVLSFAGSASRDY